MSALANLLNSSSFSQKVSYRGSYMSALANLINSSSFFQKSKL